MDRGTALELLQQLVGRDLRQIADERGVTVWKNGNLNKGWAGHAVERYLGLPLNSARSPNLGSWELKVVPFVFDGAGDLVPKETMAITMLDPAEVAERPFEESHLFTKLRKIIAVARIREGNDERRSICERVHAFDLEETSLFDAVAEDYRTVQRVIREKGQEALTGKLGCFVQPRTKGPGHGSVSRAFYARKEFVEHITGRKQAPRTVAEPPLRQQDCPIHAGAANVGNRAPLDSRIASLPANQSGAGRHKCPYCAYQQGYRQALDDILASTRQLHP